MVYFNQFTEIFSDFKWLLCPENYLQKIILQKMIPRDLQDNFYPYFFIFILPFFKDRYRFENDKMKELSPCCWFMIWCKIYEMLCSQYHK